MLAYSCWHGAGGGAMRLHLCCRTIAIGDFTDAQDSNEVIALFSTADECIYGDLIILTHIIPICIHRQMTCNSVNKAVCTCGNIVDILGTRVHKFVGRGILIILRVYCRWARGADGIRQAKKEAIEHGSVKLLLCGNVSILQ
jgi:hypothetical protein